LHVGLHSGVVAGTGKQHTRPLGTELPRRSIGENTQIENLPVRPLDGKTGHSLKVPEIFGQYSQAMSQCCGGNQQIIGVDWLSDCE
jgi:hypothetical protein